MKTTEIALFQGKKIRKVYYQNTWWFSVVDVVAALTDSVKARDYWYQMKVRVKEESGTELSTVCRQLKLHAPDGKLRETDCSNTAGILRIIQSIPSPKAEPFKQWLAKVGYERIQEVNDPELAVSRARRHWQTLGRPEGWIEHRMRSVEIRNKLTDYWHDNEVRDPSEYASLTNIIHKEWADVTPKQHKKVKELERENLRDHMTEAELVFTALAELSTRGIAQSKLAKGYGENQGAAHKGGRISGNARKALEKETGKKVVSGENYLEERRAKRIK